MRRITMWLVATVAALVLLFSYRTSTGGTVATAPAAPVGVVGGTPGGVTSGRTMTVNGTAAQTRWGPVQVQIKIASGRIADVAVLQQPTGSSMDQAINSFALPQLRAQALAAQSANIAGVSGATVTTGGYKASLQAAIAAARFTGTPSGVAPTTTPVPPSIAAKSDD
jgi:uncharacterized protein with FMN-binding domain